MKKTQRLFKFEKQELLDLIMNYWILNAEQRLGQLITNIAEIDKNDIYYYEDMDLLKYLRKHVRTKEK